jgi:hypothetical protein
LRQIVDTAARNAKVPITDCGFFPMYISHLYAENIFQFGLWQSFVGDEMNDFVIDFIYSDQVGELPKAHFDGGGVTLRNGVTRYYGTDDPIVFSGRKKEENTLWFLDNVKITESLAVAPQTIHGHSYSLPDGVKEEDCFSAEIKDGQMVNGKQGRMAIFMDNSNSYVGYATMNGDRIKFKSSNIKDGHYKVAIK